MISLCLFECCFRMFQVHVIQFWIVLAFFWCLGILGACKILLKSLKERAFHFFYKSSKTGVPMKMFDMLHVKDGTVSVV